MNPCEQPYNSLSRPRRTGWSAIPRTARRPSYPGEWRSRSPSSTPSAECATTAPIGPGSEVRCRPMSNPPVRQRGSFEPGHLLFAVGNTATSHCPERYFPSCRDGHHEGIVSNGDSSRPSRHAGLRDRPAKSPHEPLSRACQPYVRPRRQCVVLRSVTIPTPCWAEHRHGALGGEQRDQYPRPVCPS
jgi:hypothetical protein